MSDEGPSIGNSIISYSPGQNSTCDGRLSRPHSAISSCKTLVTGWSQDGLQTQTAWRQSTVTNLTIYVHTSEATNPPPHPPAAVGTDESGRWMEQSKTKWPRLYRKTPGEKQPAWVINEKKKKNPHRLAGREVSSHMGEAWMRGPSSPIMMLIVYRHPLTVQSALL